MKRIILFAILTFCSITGLRAQGTAPLYEASTVIPLTGDGGYDYLSVDPNGHRLYVSHGTEVNVVDLGTEKQVGSITGMAGVHGIAIVHELNRGFISDGKENVVVVFDLSTLKILKKIAVQAKGLDAIIYDAFSQHVYTFNGHSSSYSVIDPKGMSEVGTFDAKGAPEFAVSDEKGLIYNNLEDKNSMNVIDAKTMKVIRNFPLSPCGGPTGLAMDIKNQRLFTVCRENKGMSVLDAATGKVITTLSIGAGVDAVAYDEVKSLVIVSNGDGTAQVFKQADADHYTLAQTITTAPRAKTCALDPTTHKLYLSVASFEKGTRKALPGTFKVLTFKPVQ